MIDVRRATATAWLRDDPRRFDLVVATLTLAFSMLLLAGGPDRFDTGRPEVAAGVGAFVLLVFRSRWPWPLFVAASTWTIVHVVVLERPTPVVFAVLVLAATIALRMDRWRAIGFGVVLAAGLYWVGFHVNDVQAGDSRAVIGIVWAAAIIGVADAVRSWREYKQSADAEVRAAVLAAEAQARQQVSEERLSIARELHDLLAHNLSVMNVQTGAAMHLLRSDVDAAEQSLGAARDAGKTVLDELRELLSVLRHDDGDEAPTSSLPTVDELDALVETVRRAGLGVEWVRSGTPRALAPAVSLAAYRIAQEALTNAAKHGTGTAELTTTFTADGWSLRVVNPVGDTKGAAPSGHGLVGMRERAVANGGHLEAVAAEGRFVVNAWLPVATTEART